MGEELGVRIVLGTLLSSSDGKRIGKVVLGIGLPGRRLSLEYLNRITEPTGF